MGPVKFIYGSPNDYFHYARIPWMRQVPLRTCTTTVAKIASTSTVAVNNYFPRRTRSARNARFEGITPRRRPWTECMCCMRCIVCSVIKSSLRCPSFAVPPSRGNPEVGITPPSCMTRSRHASFCTGISVSYRNRYVAVASFSDMLPWHHFCFAAVAPFSFRHGD